jgi:hypothetical protein
MNTLYKCVNTRKCYWDCLGCLKNYKVCAITKGPGYLSVAKAKVMRNKLLEAAFFGVE